MIRHLTSYWCILTLDFILMSSNTWLHIDVFWWILLLMCISLHFCCILYIFVLYTVYFWCILEKNTNRKHISGAPFLLPVAHPIRGAWSRAPLVINTSGLICVAHQGCATEAQNGAPQIRVSLVVLIGGAQPIMADGPLSLALYKEVGVGGSNYEVHHEPHTPPTHLPI
jgi:hypothetical protein